MPFLRFTRDKRGYETTSLVHASRGRQGRARQQVLYWFRTPPNVKVGRPALDQEAIRWIEEHNPDIEFDWPKILEATPPPAAPSEDARGRRQRRDRTDRSGRSERPERRPAQRSPGPPPAVETAAPVSAVVVAPEGPQAPQIESLQIELEALEQLTHPDTEEVPPPTLSAVESVLGREQLIRLRARYAELQARIIERGGEPARVEELRAQAEGLDPDSWVTVDEARKGLEGFESKSRELRTALGLGRRRRSRRGGRRRRGGPSTTLGASPSTAIGAGAPAPSGVDPSATPGQTPEPDSSSNSVDAADDDDDTSDG